MTATDELLANNDAYAATFDKGDLPLPPARSRTFFRQILHKDLGCASYIIADGGEAAVIDPKWEIAEYLRGAEEAGAEVGHVLETHYHADHVSGWQRLVAATGAAVLLPEDAERPEAVGHREGDVLRIGRLELRAIATPGHRPEHLAYLVIDRDAALHPVWMCAPPARSCPARSSLVCRRASWN